MASQREWWQTAVIYQIYPRSFRDTSGNGVGDLPGITSRLDYVANTLGVDAIWISPFYPSPMADFGYDVADYCDVDPLFGTLDDFDDLLTEAHRLGLKVIIDWVPNHTSDQHLWFQKSRSSRDNPKRDWYVWRDGKPDGSPPNNWLSLFGGPAWTRDEATGQWYLHSFLSEQPDLNWRNPEVEEAMLDTLRFWLDRGVDGFRMDVVHFIMKDPEMRDNPPAKRPPGEDFKDLAGYETQEHLYDKGHPDVHAVFRQLRQVIDSYPDRFSIGEIHVFAWEQWAGFYGADLDELHMPYNFSLVWAPWDATEIRSRVDALEAVVPVGGWPNHVLGNHDEPRLTERVGNAAARTAAVLLLTLRGTPTIYYGDEIGMTQAQIPPERQQDPWGVNEPGLGRDGTRTPMQWTGDTHAGFSPPGAESTWLPVNDDFPERNVGAQLGESTSMLTLYRDLLRYRRSSPALRLGDYRPVETGPGVFAYIRTHQSERILVALNFTAEAAEVAISGLGSGRVAVGTHGAGASVDTPGFTLRPNEGIVVEFPD